MSTNFYEDSVNEDLDTDMPEDTEVDEAPDEVDGADEAPETESKATTSTRGGMSRAAIRRIASKAQEVSETDERIVEVTASILGTGTGLAEVTTAIMAAPRSVAAPVNDLTMVAQSDMMEAAINAAALGRDRLRAVWNLINALTGSSTAIPSANAKAALAVAKASFALDDVAKAEVEAVSELLRKN